MKQKPEIDEIIIQTCEKKQNKLHIIQKTDIQNERVKNGYEIFDYKQYQNIQVNLKGKRQTQNASLVLECCDILQKNGYVITEEAIRSGLRTVIHKGRFETIYQNPTIIFDGGHNTQAIENLKETIKMYYEKSKKIYVISVLKSKDYKNILENIIEKENVYIFTSGNDPKRYIDKHLMYEYAKQISESDEMYEMELEEAIQFCKRKTEYVSFVIGSFYIYEDVKKFII